jgi:2-keto-3-deoxy-L-rhamnonate aldolase RhmA
MVATYEKVIAACHKYLVAPGIHLTDAEQAKEWLGRGMRFFTLQNDVRFLLEGAKAATRLLRQRIS